MKKAILLLLIVATLSSCGSQCRRTKKYWRSHKYVYQSETTKKEISHDVNRIKRAV